MTRLSGVTGTVISRKIPPQPAPIFAARCRAGPRRSPSRADGVRVTTRRPPRHPDRARRTCRPRRQAVGADAPPEEPTPRRPRPSNHAVMTSRRRRTSRCVAAPSGGPGVAASRRRWTSPPAAGRCRWRPVPRASCWEGVVACRCRRRCRGQPWRPLLAVCDCTVQYRNIRIKNMSRDHIFF